jgi:hypothetical protein
LSADAAPDAIHRHENVASLMTTTPARSFLDMYHNNITELKRNFMTYIKGLRATSATPSDVTPSRLQLTEDGFPILPSPWKGSEYKKKELEEWFKLYVGQHYSTLTCYSTNHYLSPCRASQ